MKKEAMPSSVSSFKPLLTWASQMLSTTITRPSQLTDGLCYYRLFCLAFPGRVLPNRIHHQPNNISEMNGNLRILLEEMRKMDGKCRSINLQKLSKGIQQQHMAMLKWLKDRIQERQHNMQEPDTQDEQNIQIGNVFVKPPKKIVKVMAPPRPTIIPQKFGLPEKPAQKLSKQQELDESMLKQIQEIVLKEREEKAQSKIERIKKILNLHPESIKKTPNTQSMLLSLRQRDEAPVNKQERRYEVARLTCPPRETKSSKQTSNCNRQSLLIKTTPEQDIELERQMKQRRSMNLLEVEPQNDS